MCMPGARVSPIWIGDGVIDRAAALLDAQHVGARRFIVSSPAIWRLHGERLSRALGPSEPILIPDGERFKNLQSVSRIYEALIRAGADRGSTIVAVGGGVDRRHRRVCRGDVPARHHARAHSHDAARAGGQLDRRQGRRQPCTRQEPDRRVSPAVGRADRSPAARHAAATRVPIRAVRGRQIRHDREPRPVRPRGPRHQSDLRARARSAAARRSSSRAASRQTSCPRTSARATCAGSSITVTPSATRSKRSRSTAASATARRSPTACWRLPTSPSRAAPSPTASGRRLSPDRPARPPSARSSTCESAT